MNSGDGVAILTALATTLLVVVGLAQVLVLVMQRRQACLTLIEIYRKRWAQLRRMWAVTVFFGREPEEYYQVASKELIKDFRDCSAKAELSAPTLWAIESIQSICSTLSDVCLKVLQGQLAIEDTYPVFGTELLRHSSAIRVLLDTTVIDRRFMFVGIHGIPSEEQESHYRVRKELQNWLIYHDGIRRRCLILIDLLWAEAARLEDLPPNDLKSAANAKIKSGHLNRRRLNEECRRLNVLKYGIRGMRLSRFLRNAEFKESLFMPGINRKRLDELEREWTKRLLRKPI